MILRTQAWTTLVRRGLLLGLILVLCLAALHAAVSEHSHCAICHGLHTTEPPAADGQGLPIVTPRRSDGPKNEHPPASTILAGLRPERAPPSQF